MDYIKNTAIVIPALNPDEKMTELVGNLRNVGFSKIILVDDGSEIKNRVFFRTCKEEYGCKIIRHVLNFGKGTALKSAFNYILDEDLDVSGVVTCDCDGQHTVGDVTKCAELSSENPDALILGCRDFSDKKIPTRSRFGNRFTHFTLKFLSGLSVSDTQTGLRGIPIGLLREHFAATKGERYEYEMNMLLAARDEGIDLVEFPIKTIYIDGNKSSNFNPFRDSIKIYKVFLKFLLSSFSSFLIDIFFYWIFGLVLRPIIGEEATIFGMSLLILLRTVLARCISSIYNFLINKTKVFKNNSSTVLTALKYYLLVVVQLSLSAFFVNYAFTFIPYSTVRKVIVDALLFVVNFLVQREWVFKNK